MDVSAILSPTVHRFMQKALAACPDSEMSLRILFLLMDELAENYRGAISMSDFFLDIEQAGP